jgi:hypothetical protein
MSGGEKHAADEELGIEEEVKTNEVKHEHIDDDKFRKL